MSRRMRTREEARLRVKSFADVAKRFESWRPASEVLQRVTALPTIFPWFNRATRVGGYPLKRFCMVHGPSNHGKTAFVHGLGLSFLMSGNLYAYVDAEYTTPEDWLVTLMSEQAKNPGFLALLPRSYEETTKAVREFAEGLQEAREKKEIDPDVTALIAIDSIRKLVPERILAKIAKEEGGIDGANGRAAMYRAALNASWLDELTPLLYHTNTSLIFVARESENVEGDKFEPEFKVGGGKAPVFDSSLVMRCTRSKWVQEGPKDDPRIIGEQHRVRITKTKIGGKDGKFTDSFFHTCPQGFDRARDVVELATELGIFDQSGSWLSFDGERIANGVNNVVARLRADAALMEKIEARFVLGEGEEP